MKNDNEKGGARLFALSMSALVLVAGLAFAASIQGTDSTGHLREVLTDTSGRLLTNNAFENAAVDDDAIDNCDDLSASSEQYTLPSAGSLYEIRVEGNCASVLCGTNPTATTAKNGHFIKVCDGVPWRGVLTGSKCAHIAPSAAGEICYILSGP